MHGERPLIERPFQGRRRSSRRGSRRPRGQQSQGSRNESSQGPQHPTLRANPFSEVTDLLCRLPLSTLLYRPEAAHLGDLMWLCVRPGVRIKHVHGIFKGRRERTRTGQKVPRFPAQPTLSPDKPIPGSAEGVNEKRQLSPGLSPTSPIALVSPLKYPRPGAGILTRFPFDSGGTEAASSERTSPIS